MPGSGFRLTAISDVRRAEDRYLSSRLLGHLAGTNLAWPHDRSLGVGRLSGKAVAAHLPEVALWASEVRSMAQDAGCEVVSVERRVGRESAPIPTAIRVPTPESSARIARSARIGEVRRMRARMEHLETAFPLLDGTARTNAIRMSRKWDEARFLTAVRAAEWLRDNPSSDGVLARSVPIPGVHAKFLDSATNVRFVEECIGSPVRVRRSHLGRYEWRDLSPAAMESHDSYHLWVEGEPDNLAFIPKAVLVVENMDAFDMLPPVPGMVAMFGAGAQVTGGALPDFVTSSTNLLYWGDLDADGYAILGSFRARCPQVRSVMMNAETIGAFGRFGTNDAARGAALDERQERAAICLSPEERLVYQEQVSPSPTVPRRLEQERLPADYVATCLRAAVTEPPQG